MIFTGMAEAFFEGNSGRCCNASFPSKHEALVNGGYNRNRQLDDSDIHFRLCVEVGLPIQFLVN